MSFIQSVLQVPLYMYMYIPWQLLQLVQTGSGLPWLLHSFPQHRPLPHPPHRGGSSWGWGTRREGWRRTGNVERCVGRMLSHSVSMTMTLVTPPQSQYLYIHVVIIKIIKVSVYIHVDHTHTRTQRGSN